MSILGKQSSCVATGNRRNRSRRRRAADRPQDRRGDTPPVEYCETNMRRIEMPGFSRRQFLAHCAGAFVGACLSQNTGAAAQDRKTVCFGLCADVHPALRYTVPYGTPLFAVVTVKPEGELLIEGRTANFVPPTPCELGRDGEGITAGIIDRKLRFTPRLLNPACCLRNSLHKGFGLSWERGRGASFAADRG